MRRLVERMAGCIEMRSTVGEGSEFRVLLPAAEPLVPASLSSVPIALGPAPTPAGDVSLSVLHIEVNPVNVMLVATRRDARFSAAKYSPSGVARALADRSDVELFDMQLPGIDGLGARRLKASS